MEYGTGIRPERVDKALAKVGGLRPGERPLMYLKVNNFRLGVDMVAITDSRLIALGSLTGKIGFEAPLALVTEAEYDSQKSTIRIRTSGGREEILKLVAPQDVPHAEYVIEDVRRYLSAHPRPAPLALPPAPAPIDATPSKGEARAAAKVEKDEARATARAEKDEARATAKAERQAASDEKQRQRTAAKEKLAQKHAEAVKAAGRLVARESFAMHRVEIYENGFVRVSVLALPGEPFERLLSIDASSDVSKKTALGRGLGAVATGGMNMLGSNKRGDVYLTIFTDARVHKLHVDPPTAGSLAASKALAAAGNAVLDALARRDTAQAQAGFAPATQSSSDRLRELASMRDEGLVTPAEYDTMRQKVLDTL